MAKTQPDIFICHASEDKQFVKKIAKALQTYGIKVWLDEWELKVGDSLHSKIEEGIKHSSYMLVVVSRNSLKKPWVKRELTAGLAKELSERKVYVVPALFDVSPEDLPPLLADKLAADFRRDFTEGIRAILHRLGITDRLRRMENPTAEDIRKVYDRLPSEQKRILLHECWERASQTDSGDFVFETQFLDSWERRALYGLIRRDLIRVKLVKKGPFWDDSEGELFGWIYRGNFTNLGNAVAKMVYEEDQKYWAAFRQKQKGTRT